ncbi:hypothetical protein DSO57_1025746 [Entomophthora muscae]|uniref:Uncharacterized protein n=1 Tax=Entomophthora muscae TaxID=34485 RepID=A0ACC2RH19_9FUNG|nr:hypothetical protein DSO57_1025746 [Entomophthora muscae]
MEDTDDPQANQGREKYPGICKVVFAHYPKDEKLGISQLSLSPFARNPEDVGTCQNVSMGSATVEPSCVWGRSQEITP